MSSFYYNEDEEIDMDVMAFRASKLQSSVGGKGRRQAYEAYSGNTIRDTTIDPTMYQKQQQRPRIAIDEEEV